MIPLAYVCRGQIIFASAYNLSHSMIAKHLSYLQRQNGVVTAKRGDRCPDQLPKKKKRATVSKLSLCCTHAARAHTRIQRTQDTSIRRMNKHSKQPHREPWNGGIPCPSSYRQPKILSCFPTFSFRSSVVMKCVSQLPHLYCPYCSAPFIFFLTFSSSSTTNSAPSSTTHRPV